MGFHGWNYKYSRSVDLLNSLETLSSNEQCIRLQPGLGPLSRKGGQGFISQVVLCPAIIRRTPGCLVTTRLKDFSFWHNSEWTLWNDVKWTCHGDNLWKDRGISWILPNSVNERVLCLHNNAWLFTERLYVADMIRESVYFHYKLVVMLHGRLNSDYHKLLWERLINELRAVDDFFGLGCLATEPLWVITLKGVAASWKTEVGNMNYTAKKGGAFESGNV